MIGLFSLTEGDGEGKRTRCRRTLILRMSMNTGPFFSTGTDLFFTPDRDRHENKANVRLIHDQDISSPSLDSVRSVNYKAPSPPHPSRSKIPWTRPRVWSSFRVFLSLAIGSWTAETLAHTSWTIYSIKTHIKKDENWIGKHNKKKKTYTGYTVLTYIYIQKPFF
jgi:hypothetical protein